MWDLAIIWNCLALAIAAAGVGLLAWALFADRAKGHLRCPKCWYALDGTPKDDAELRKCPECGRGKLRERSLKRTRRRWRFAVLALLVLVFADQTRRIPEAQVRGWVALVPTTLIIPLAPWQADRWARTTIGGEELEDLHWLDALSEEFFRREEFRECWVWQANSWADAASLRKLSQSGLLAHSLDVQHLLEYPDWPHAHNLPSTPDLEQDTLDLFMASVAFESWVSCGGSEGEAWLLGSRLFVINKLETVRGVAALHDQLLFHARQVDWPTKLPTIELSSPLNPPLCLDFLPLLRSREMDGFATWSFTSDLSLQLSTRLYPDEWRENGGDGLWMNWAGVRLVVSGRPPLLERVLVNLPECIRATLRNYDQDAEYRPSEEEPPLE